MRLRCGWVSCVVGGVLGAAALSRGATAEAPPLSYTLKEAVQRSIEQNLSLRAQQMEWGISKWGVLREWAAFEPQLTGSARQESNARKNTVEQQNSPLAPLFEEENRLSKLAVEGFFFSGAQYNLGYTLNDLSNSLTNRFTDLAYESEYQSFLGISVTQPLLKSAGLTPSMAGIRLATAQERIGFQDLRRVVMDIVARTEVVYWELVEAQALYFSRVDSVKIATKVLEDNRERVKTGKMPELEVYQAEAGVARRTAARDEAHTDWITAMSRLRALFSDPPTDPAPLIIVSDAELVEDMHLDLQTGMYLVTQLQPDYLSRKYQLTQENVRLSYAKNQRWPQVDLVGSYGFNGLADSPSGSWDDIQEGDFGYWSIGVQLAIPLGGDQRSRGELHAARLRQKQALINLKSTEIELHNAVDASIQRLKSLRQNISNYEVMVDYSERLLEVELRRLETGKSHSRQVLEYEEELLASRDAYRRSRNEYRKALLAFELTSGTILATRNLEQVAGREDPDAETTEIDVEPGVKLFE